MVADHFRRQGAQFADLTDGVETESLWRVVMPLTGPAPSDGELENLVLALPKFATVRVDDATDVLTAVFPAPGPGIASETFRQAAYSTLGDGYGQGSLRVQLDNDRL